MMLNNIGIKKIGITGGIGAGKSYVLDILKENCKCVILRADDVANDLKLPGQVCYKPVIELLSEDILDENGYIDRAKMAEIIFKDETLLKKVNAIIHPAVKDYIRNAFLEAERDGYEYFFLEAALLIEDNYREILDEVWYVRAPLEIRIQRLIDSRGYSREKAVSIINKQLSDDDFINNSDRVIDNSGNYENVCEQVKRILSR